MFLCFIQATCYITRFTLLPCIKKHTHITSFTDTISQIFEPPVSVKGFIPLELTSSSWGVNEGEQV